MSAPRPRSVGLAGAIAAGALASVVAASALTWRRMNREGLVVGGNLLLGPAYRGPAALDEERYALVGEAGAVEVRRRDGNGLVGCGVGQSFGPIRSLPLGVVAIHRNQSPRRDRLGEWPPQPAGNPGNNTLAVASTTFPTVGDGAGRMPAVPGCRDLDASAKLARLNTRGREATDPRPPPYITSP